VRANHGLLGALAALLVAALLVASPSRPANASDDSPSDIPGVLWAGGRLEASVGGGTYDRVWRLVLDAPRVLNVRTDPLEANGEFGLYLLASGLPSLQDEFFELYTIKSSSKPGARQALTLALRPGTYYLNVNGRNADRPYRFRLTATLIADPTPPTLTVAAPASRVAGRDAVVALTSRDALSGVSAYRVRVGEQAWEGWVDLGGQSSIARDVAVRLPGVGGLHRVDVQTRNSLGMESDVASTTLFLDLVAPTATRTSPSATGGSFSDARPVIRYRFSEAMDAQSWRSGGLVVTDAEGSAIPGVFSYSAKAREGTWTPSAPLALGATIVVTQGLATDVAGNAAPIEAWSATRLAATKLAATAPAASSFIDTRLVLRAAASGLADGTVVWLERQEGEEWTRIQSAEVGAGVARMAMNPPVTGRYRWHYVSDGLRASATSAEFSVGARPRLVLAGGQAATARRVAVGGTVSLVGSSNPAGLAVSLVRYRCNAAFTSCTPVESVPLVAGADGTFSHAWVPTKGTWGWAVKSDATADYAAGSSPIYRFRAP